MEGCLALCVGIYSIMALRTSPGSQHLPHNELVAVPSCIMEGCWSISCSGTRVSACSEQDTHHPQVLIVCSNTQRGQTPHCGSTHVSAICQQERHNPAEPHPAGQAQGCIPLVVGIDVCHCIQSVQEEPHHTHMIANHRIIKSHTTATGLHACTGTAA
jgi:hypothetical protein